MSLKEDKTVLRLTGDMLVDVANTDELYKALYRAVEYIDTDVGTNLNMTSLVLKQFADQLKAPKRPSTLIATDLYLFASIKLLLCKLVQ